MQSKCTPRARFGPTPRPVADRFWPKVDKAGPVPAHRPDLGECWLWIGARYPNGYGQFLFQRRLRGAHVVAYIITTGHEPPPENPIITHLCDGGGLGCVRPSHLEASTTAGNVADKVAKRRHRHGESAPQAKVTEAMVIEIRGRYANGAVTHQMLADAYGVSRSQIGLIISGKNWKHVTPPSPSSGGA